MGNRGTRTSREKGPRGSGEAVILRRLWCLVRKRNVVVWVGVYYLRTPGCINKGWLEEKRAIENQ